MPKKFHSVYLLLCICAEAQVEDRNEQTDTAVDDNSQRAKKSKHRAKLLQFCENRRPAYFGTWTKRSKQVTPRRPFAKDDEVKTSLPNINRHTVIITSKD